MDPKLEADCINDDVEGLSAIVRQDRSQLKTVTPHMLDTPLHLVSEVGHAGSVELIVREEPKLVARVNKRKETALHKASSRGFLDVVRMLLVLDVAVAEKLDSESQSAFFLACKGGHVEVAKELRKKTMSGIVELPDRRGRSVLFRASEHGHSRVVEYLLSTTQLLGLERDGQQTSLHIAASNGHADVVRKILEKHSRMAWYSDDQGLTPMHLAARGGHAKATMEFWNSNQDLHLNVTPEDKLNPLHLAAVAGHSRIILEILEENHDLARQQTKKGETILHLCIRYNKYAAMVDLLENLNLPDFDIVNVRDRNGNTILHHAIIEMSLQMVGCLMKKTNVDINAQNNAGLTALDLAKSANAIAIIRELQKAMAERSPSSGVSTAVDLPGLIPNNKSSLGGNKREGPERTRPHGPRHLSSTRRRSIKKDHHRLKNNLIALCGVIIAAAYNCGLNPPGGFHPDGQAKLTGKAVLGCTNPYVVYMLFCYYTLFSAAGVGAALVSTLTIAKAEARVLELCQMGTYSALLSLMLVYVTGLWMSVPHRGINQGVMVAVPCTAAGIVISFIFIWKKHGGVALGTRDGSESEGVIGHGTDQSHDLENGSNLANRRMERHRSSCSSSSDA